LDKVEEVELLIILARVELEIPYQVKALDLIPTGWQEE